MMNKKNISAISFFFIIFFAIVSCSGGEMEQQKVTYSKLKDISNSDLVKLSKTKFYFGHHSVGRNILDGIRDCMEEYPEIKLKIVRGHDAGSIVDGGILENGVGKNLYPHTKIEDFVKFVGTGIGKNVDAVAMKFCYVDIMANDDPSELFSAYVEGIEKIRSTYPDLTIVHFTAPLTIIKSGPKAFIKKILGRQLWSETSNINRYKYNELLKAKYQGKEPVLDIAQIESTFPDGARCTFKVDDKIYYSLIPAYTDDGEHLNEIGRKKVAEKLLILLAGLD